MTLIPPFRAAVVVCLLAVATVDFLVNGFVLPLHRSSTTTTTAAVALDGGVKVSSTAFVHRPFSSLLPMTTTDTDATNTDKDTAAAAAEDKVSSSSSSSSTLPIPFARPEYAALLPGTMVNIQVGDVGLARKAWKKRRRSGSPLLVPCSVIDMDRESMVRWNILYLLQKFGTSLNELKNNENVGFTGKKGVALGMAEIGKLYKQHLGSSLTKHAKAFGYSSPRHLVQSLFSKRTQEEYGIKVWMPPKEKYPTMKDSDRPLWIVLPISRHRARTMASQTALVQFAAMPEPNQDAGAIPNNKDDVNDDNDNEDIHDHVHMEYEEYVREGLQRMRHTGIIRVKNPDSSSNHNNSGNTGTNNNNNLVPPHKMEPLSAAIRVSQKDVDEKRVQNGSIHSVVVFSYDSNGDNGLPLLTTSLNHDQVSDRLKKLQSVRKHRVTRSFGSLIKDSSGNDGLHHLKDLKVGDGPIQAKVMKVSKKSSAAFLDCNVGRNVSKQLGGGMTRVMAMLRFDDIVAATLGKDGAVVDEEANVIETAIFGMDSDEMEWDDDDDDDDDGDVMTLEDLFSKIDEDVDEEGEESEDISDSFTNNEDGTLTFVDPETGETEIIATDDDGDDDDDDDEEGVLNEGRMKKISLKVGDTVDVYIKGVSKQSGRFTVTMDSSVQGKKAKDIKRDNEAEKKLSRLAAKFGGDDGLEKILSLSGTECTGTVKASSNTGNWLYVQPDISDLPVGIATVSNSGDSDTISRGDTVQIRLDGIDESRGQIAMTVLEKKST